MSKFVMFAFLFWLIMGCSPKFKILTVNGPISPDNLGKTLHHEHLLVDFIGADSIDKARWNLDSVVLKVLPYLKEIKQLGYASLVECTPEFLGRDPLLLKRLSDESGVQLITNTGLYSAVGGKFLPPYVSTETPDQLAARWINESVNGIEKSGVFPGFIKIGVEREPLGEIQKKIVTAAALTHLATGLTIMSHTGLAVPAFQQLEILKKNGVAPSAFIWTHAQNEKEKSRVVEAARMGTWIAYDNFNGKNLSQFVDMALTLKNEGLLHRLMFSHDAGWYRPGEPGGGNFRGFSSIERELVPALRKAGFSQGDLEQIFILNPAEAFTIRVRKAGKRVSE